MKKSQLKEMIKSAVLEDDNYYEDTVDEGLFDFLKKKKEAAPVKQNDPNPIIGVDYDGNYIRKDGTMAEGIDEAEEVDVEDNEEVDVDIEKDVKVDDESVESDIEVKGSMPGEDADEVAVQSLLMKAQEEAAKLGDEKLTDQIGNTITYFTRAHVSKVDADVNEETDYDNADAVSGDINITNDNPAEDAEVGMALDESIIRFRKLAGIIK